MIIANQCHFRMYDQDGDDLITRKEMIKLFVDSNLGFDLFNDLDNIKGKQNIHVSYATHTPLCNDERCNIRYYLFVLTNGKPCNIHEYVEYYIHRQLYMIIYIYHAKRKLHKI